MNSEIIKEYYINQKNNLEETARLLGISRFILTNRMKELGISIRNKGQVKGRRSANWQGGSRISKGYRFLYKPNHPNSGSNGYIFEHRFVMSEYLGRPLKPEEVVHHKNSNRLDNRIQNLELCVNQSAHMKMEFKLDKPNTENGNTLKEMFESGMNWDEIAKQVFGD